MTNRLWMALIAASIALATPGRVARAGLPPLPDCGAAPLSFVRFAGPDGLHVAFAQAGRIHDFAAPVQVGLRPGYTYRVMLTGFPGRPAVALFPTLEVRGTLRLAKVHKASDFPATIPLSADDIDRAIAGALVTKVVVLEDPERAYPQFAPRDEPFETRVEPGTDPCVEGREHGRLMVVLRLGGRHLTPEEFQAEAIPGTLLLPKQQGLALPRVPPCLPWACWPVVDPFHGPRVGHEECLRDGGDCGMPVGLDRNGNLGGLDPSDTVAAYTDSRGRRRLTISNKVCVCVPRFVVIRGECAPAGFDLVQEPNAIDKVRPNLTLATTQPTVQAECRKRPEDTQSRIRPSGATMVMGTRLLIDVVVLIAVHLDLGPFELIGREALHELTARQREKMVQQAEAALVLSKPKGVHQVESAPLGPLAVGRVDGVNVLGTVMGPLDFTTCTKDLPQVPERPLLLYKWVDKLSAQVGDEVTFSLKYSNHGGRPVSDVAITDSLTGRLEYVPGSAQSNRDAVFTTRSNEAGSAILQWEISGPLQPGESGVVRFKARIR